MRNSEQRRAQLVPVTDVPIDRMAALLKNSSVLIGDDTGALIWLLPSAPTPSACSVLPRR